MKLLKNFFRDQHGHIVIAQMPNSPLIGWLIATLINLFWQSATPKTHALLDMLAFGFIFTWAWLEITSGVNYFRRILGVVVLMLVVWSRWV